MLITFVKPIQVEAYRTDNRTWNTRMDAAYGEFIPDDDAAIQDGMVGMELHEGIQNNRDGTITRFGLGLMTEEITDIQQNPARREERKLLLDNWDRTPPEDKWLPTILSVRPDNIRGYTS